MPHGPLRVTGLVALMHQVRAELNAGLPPEAVPTLKDHIAASLTQVEQICRDRHRAPAHLPAPSYKAYLYLKGLDFTHLGARQPLDALAPRPIKIRNLIAIVEGLRPRLELLAQAASPPAAGDPDVLALARTARAEAARVEALCAERRSTPAGLPAQSRRAYQWLSFLAEPAQLVNCVGALRLIKELLGRTKWAWLPRVAGRPVRVEFFPTTYLYRMRVRSGLVHIAIAPGFMDAPPEVLDAVLRCCLGYVRKVTRDQVLAYAASSDFAETTMALEVCTEAPPGSLRGTHFDLDHVFERVNAAYFGRGLDRPRLTWSRSNTGRLLGYYQSSTDRLMISLALDDQSVPDCAIDLVMYHELLHKQLGLPVVNGRQQTHTPAFRAAERQFRQFAEARAFLEAWDKAL